MSRYFSARTALILLISLAVAINIAWLTRLAQIEIGKSRLSGGSITFGIADPDLVGETARTQAYQLAAMRSIGITSVRVDANWSWVQPSGPTIFDWTKLDEEVNTIRAAGMSVELIIDGCPPWAAVPSAAMDPFPQPASPAQYATWAADVAARYAPKGVEDFEIWNEPNIVRFWQPKPNPVAYTADLVAAYAAIKSVDPSGFVISGGLAPAANDGTNYSPISFLEAMYAHGAKGSFDALGYHPYSFPALPDTYKSWSAWSQMALTKPSIRSIMAQNGDFDKPIWITEFGAPSTGPSGIGANMQRTELSQALAYVKKAKWIGAFYIFTWQDTVTGPSGDDGFGLFTDDGAPKPAYSAVVLGLDSGSS
jgi:polysaccharide biosynthesis protein PslG